MPTATENAEAISALKDRVNALERQLSSFKWAGSVAGFVVLALFGVGHYYEVPKVATETFDRKVAEQVGVKMLSRMKELNSEFDRLASAQQVATDRVLEGAKTKLVSLDEPYLIVWADTAKRWNLDINGGMLKEGQPVDISENGLQRWKIVRARK